MKSLRMLSLLALAAGAALAQAPAITFVGNGASYIPPGMPNAGVAQGALFVIKGSNLGPASFVIANAFPLQTSIAGTSVKVTVGGRTVDAIMYYSGASQVAAILPSSTPTGTGTVTVTYNGQTSATAPISVVQNALGIFTVASSGGGDAIATGNGLVSPTNSANPGETVALWGTGLGPVTFDETRAAQQSDMTNIPVEAYVGGQRANVVFRGRNGCCTAVDTVYIQIPSGVSGCVVPVVFKIGNILSNTTSIPVASSGRVCTPTTPGLSSVSLSTVLSKSTLSYGGLTLNRTVTTTAPITVGGITVSPGGTTKTDTGGGSFFKITIPPGGLGASSAVDVATFGSCVVSVFTAASGAGPQGSVTSLDAGPSIALSGPGGARTLSKLAAGGLSVYSATLDSAGNYLNAGQYTFTGTGGADVGPFTAQLTLPPPLTWTNQAAITTVNRAGGVTVTWTGGDPAGYVQITGSSTAGTSAATAATASFTCTARVPDGSFTVPSIVLLALPASGSVSSGGVSVPIPGSLSVGSASVSVPFQAPGLDFGGAGSYVFNFSQVTYQ